MKRCRACRRHFDHRMLPKCPHCGKTTTTIQALLAENRRLRAQVTSLQEHNTAEVERRRKADEAATVAIREMSAYARLCGDLEAKLCAQLVEHPGRKAVQLVLGELRRAKLKYPHFVSSLDQALVVLSAEHGELASAILKGDISGEHGIIVEAAQVAAVAIRIIERSLRLCVGEASA